MTLEKFLTENKYQILGYNSDNSIVWYIREYGTKAYIVTIADMRRKELTGTVLKQCNEELQQKLEPVLHKQIENLTLVVAAHSKEALHFCREQSNYWYLDATEQKMYLYEHQTVDFDSIAKKLENWIDVNGISLKKRESLRHTTFLDVLPFVFVVAIYGLMYFLVNIMGMADLSELALSYTGVFYEGKWYQIFTHTLIHGDFTHLLMNGFILMMAAGFAVRMYKSGYLLLGYLWSGLVAAAFTLAQQYYFQQDILNIGASGAIYGILGMALFYILSHREKFKGIGTIHLILFIVLILVESSLFLSFTDGVNHLAHVAGFLGGFIFSFGLELIDKSLKKNRKKEGKDNIED